MALPAISVAMSVYNCERYLAPAIESILAQTFGDFEFLILNDGSSDGSAAIIERYAQTDPRIRAIHRENRGLIASLNELLAEARAPVVARMDGDDVAYPDRFAKQYTFLTANPDFGVVSSWTDDINGDSELITAGTGGHPSDYEGFLSALHHSTPICHPATMYRRDLVLQAGGYHQAYRHCEDYDLWCRMADVTKLCSLPERLMQYRRTVSQVSNRHIVEQQINAAIAYQAWMERRAGRPDPTANLTEMPPIEALDELFGRPGVGRAVQARVAPGIVYSHTALSGHGFDIVMSHIKGGGDRAGMLRTVVRLLRFGELSRAATLFATLMAA